MDNFFFWKKWTKEYQIVFLLTLSMLILSSIFLIYTSFFNIDFLGGWGFIQNLTTLPIDFQKFTSHYHEFKIDIINYLIYEKYTSTLVELNPNLVLVYMVFIFSGFTFFITISTTLSKYLYYFSMLIAMVFLATLNLDLLEIKDGISKTILTIVVLIYGGTSYAIYSYFYSFGILKRLAIFSSITIALIAFIYLFSPLDADVIHYHIAGYAGSSLIILTAAFIFYVSIENTLTLLYLNSNNKQGSLTTYILLNLLYIAMLILKVFYKVNIYGVNEFSLLLIASFSTIWGTLKRNEDNQLGDTVARVLIIMIVGSLALSTLGFHSANQNSPLMSAMEKVVFICFLGYGAMFFIYVMVNFIGLLHEKLDVYKIVFQPNDFTAFRMYTLGAIACVAIFAYRYQKKPYFQALSAYYNGVADSYYIKNDALLAEPFYNYAKSNDPFNNRSNVALANIAIKNGDLKKAIEHYNYAIIGDGNEQAYIQLSNIYQQKGDYFDALFTLKEGAKKYPESYKIWNNLGLLSRQSSMHDTTVYYFSKSIENAPSGEYTPTNNLITFLLRKGFHQEGKELIESIDADEHDLKIKAAIAAYNAKNGIFNQWEKKPFRVDSNLTNEELAYLFNHFINNISLMDSADLTTLNKTLEAPNNLFNFEPITVLKAFYEFYNGDPVSAKDHMAALASGTSFYSGYYNNLLGKWMLLHNNYRLANTYFSVANQYNFQGGKFNHAFTESLLGNSAAYDSLWQELGKGGKSYIKASTQDNLDSLSDFEKLLSISLFGKEPSPEFVNHFTENQTKNLAKIELTKHYIKNNKFEKAEVLVNELKNEDDLSLENSVAILETKILINNKNYEKAANLLNTINTSIEFKNEEYYLKAKVSELLGDSVNAEKIYQLVTYKYPYYENGLLNYAKFLESQGKTSKAYDVVVQGVKDLAQSEQLLKLYILLCIDESLTNYAEESLIELKNLLSKEEFNEFKVEYDRKLAAHEKKFNQW